MIRREDVLSMEYLKKTEYTGGYRGMRYRLEKSASKADNGDDISVLLVTIWPEPFNFFTTPEELKEKEEFTFDEDGVVDAIAWMNDRYFEEHKRFEEAPKRWDNYKMS